eukprot:scaffold14483_cov105-Isochrysis_galbana.AAC.1
MPRAALAGQLSDTPDRAPPTAARQYGGAWLGIDPTGGRPSWSVVVIACAARGGHHAAQAPAATSPRRS